MMPPQDRCVRIFACVALVAAVQLAVSNATSSVLAPHPMRSAAGAPGLYANYDWPKSSPSSPDMEVDHVWTTIPSGSDSNGNGVFASSQYWYESYGQACPNRSDHGMSCNSAGYMGSQVMRGKDGAERHVFIFSCWDADTAHRVGWTVDMDDQGNGCSRFGGEGTGSHCMLAVPPVQGIKYSFKVAFDGKNESGAFWTGKLTSTEPSTGVERVQTVGTLFYPHLPKMVGFGQFKIQSDDFLEYFLGGDCAKAVDVAVGISGPYFNGKTVTPLQAYPAYGTVGPNSCNRSAVRRCIPGGQCGKPNVLLTGGKDVIRDVPDKTPLWE